MPLFKKADKLKMQHLICELSENLMFMPDSPAMNKLKELFALRMDKNLDGFTDDELVKQLERRGFEVSIYTEKKIRCTF
jgi:maltose-binding protein MalE